MELTWFPRRPLNYIQGSDCAATGTRVGERPRFSGSVPHLPQQAHREAAAARAWTAAGAVAPSETARSLGIFAIPASEHVLKLVETRGRVRCANSVLVRW